ncbi:MAG TPA: translocation/assembly module TamB domain-containing protein [Gemmatimonadaceae bacterium]|nr:translocation/assembly module TamB domain-containing protein [Gemmatimonadaceae bacterium]
MRRPLLIAGAIVLALAGLAALTLFVVTGTDFGRERVRRFAVDALNNAVNGTVRIGAIGGNLLGGATLHDVSIVDSAGAPFLSVERVDVRYSLRDLLEKRIYLDDLTLVRPVVVLDRPSDGDWNYERIFESDTSTVPDSTLGFGDWIAFTDVRLIGGHLTVRMPWEPDDGLAPAARDSAIAEALGGDGRAMVVRTENGLQQVMEFQSVNATLPRLRIADPDSSEMLIRVASASLRALPFRPPAAEVTDLIGDFLIAGDSVYWRDVTAELPGTRLTSFSGTYEIEPGDLWLDVHGEQVALADLRWLYPPIPSEGGGAMHFRMVIEGDSMDYVARDATLRSGATTIAGQFGLAITDSLRFHGTALRYSGLDTRLIEQLAPTLELPRRGTLGGTTSLSGTLGRLAIQADVTFDDVAAGRSHVVASGIVAVGDAFGAEALRVRADPVQLALVQAVVPDFPIGGVLDGTATITGSTERWRIADADLTHREGGAVSRMIGRADIALAGRRFVDAELRLAPLALATVGRFVPAAELRGSASGTVTARGPFSALVIAGDLRLPDGGALEIAGTADIDAGDPGYDVEARLRVFDARAVTGLAPPTSITAHFSARGRGIDPETMRAAFALDASASTVDSVSIDTVYARVRVADGLLAVEPIRLAAGSSRAEVEGTFGLTAGREGTLHYRVSVDSLRELSRWIVTETDTGRVQPRPGRQAARIAQARADSAELARATVVQRAAVGGVEPQLVVDTLTGLPADSLSGSVMAAGTITGNLHRFTGRGRAAGERIVAMGNTAERIRAEYAVAKTDTTPPRLAAGIAAKQVEAGGFEFDSADVRLSYAAGAGTLEAAVHHERVNEYVARAEFELDVEESRLEYSELQLRFDTATWVSTRPGRVLWGPNGLVVQEIELQSGDGGRIYANGVLPQTGSMDVELVLNGVQVAHFVELLQSAMDAEAVVTATARLQGTREAPTIRGAVAVTSVALGGVAAPDIRGTFEYKDRMLLADGIASRHSLPLASVHAELPLDLAFEVAGDRLLPSPISIELVADSLPLETVPQFTDAISDLRGRLIGKMVINGTYDRPRPLGAFALDLGSLRVVASGTHVVDVHGTVRLSGDTIFIDELNGRTRGDGTVQLRGTIGIASLAEPSFDLQLDAEGALLLNNEQGRVYADAGLDMVGPFDGVEIIGGVNILEGVVYIPKPESRTALSASDPAVFAVVDTARAFRRDLLEPESPLLENLVVDVAVFISRGTFARSHEANIEVHTPEDPLRIRLDQQRDQVDVLGTLATERGQYQVAGRRFDITRGSALFIGGGELNPLIQFVGERQVELVGREALEIRVLIGGTALNPRITLESDAQPPISQTDLLAYLAFGRSGSSLLQVQGSALSGQGTASGQLVGDVAALATRQLAAVALGAIVQELQQDVARGLSADVLNITPADIPAEFNASGVESLVKGTEIQAGKYFSSRTFVSTQVRPASGTVLGLRVEQRLPKGYRIEATFEPRFLLREPTLGEPDPARAVRVVGAFLIWERRF